MISTSEPLILNKNKNTETVTETETDSVKTDFVKTDSVKTDSGIHLTRNVVGSKFKVRMSIFIFIIFYLQLLFSSIILNKRFSDF